MALDDRIGNKVDDLTGKAKETTGRLADDNQLEAEGQADQAKAGLKDVVEDVKDALSGAAEKVANVFKK